MERKTIQEKMKMEYYSDISERSGTLWYYVIGPNDAVKFTRSGYREWIDSFVSPDYIRKTCQKHSKRAIKNDVGLPTFP